MSNRFFSEVPLAGSRAKLAGDEAHHIRHVMRLGVGDLVTLFDGSGREFDARILSIGKHEIELNIVDQRSVDREFRGMLVVGAPLPKGDRQRFLVEKLVELGATSFVPLITVRSVAQPTTSALQRLKRYVIEASKQCARTRLMSIEDGIPAVDFFSGQSAETRVVAHIDAPAVSQVDWSDAVVIAVGPEGGFSDDELSAARTSGWQLASLGPRTLRTETAAVALAAVAGLRN